MMMMIHQKKICKGKVVIYNLFYRVILLNCWYTKMWYVKKSKVHINEKLMIVFISGRYTSRINFQFYMSLRINILYFKTHIYPKYFHFTRTLFFNKMLTGVSVYKNKKTHSKSTSS